MPRNGQKIEFPYTFEKLGRVATISFWPATGIFATYFRFAGKRMRNCFKSFESAFGYLDREFSKLDSDLRNSAALYPVRGDLRAYHELEVLLKERTDGEATLREAVDFFLAHRETRKIKSRKVVDLHRVVQSSGASPQSEPRPCQNDEGALKKFEIEFGDCWIHSIAADEIEKWLEPFGNPKTSNHYRSTAVSLFIYSRDVLQAIPEGGKLPPQRIQAANTEKKTKVEIYAPAEMNTILLACIEHDVWLIPPIVLGGFNGLRPNEVHGEDARHEGLDWENFGWKRRELNITAQKVRGLAVRDLKLPENAYEWLVPFSDEKGPVWRGSACYNERLKHVVEAVAQLRVVFDGFRHSYASYRIRQLDGNVDKLAEEMGNSPGEIINSYKLNVSDKEAEAWFAIRPPGAYADFICEALARAR